MRERGGRETVGHDGDRRLTHKATLVDQSLQSESSESSRARDKSNCSARATLRLPRPLFGGGDGGGLLGGDIERGGALARGDLPFGCGDAMIDGGGGGGGGGRVAIGGGVDAGDGAADDSESETTDDVAEAIDDIDARVLRNETPA